MPIWAAAKLKQVVPPLAGLTTITVSKAIMSHQTSIIPGARAPDLVHLRHFGLHSCLKYYYVSLGPIWR